MGVVSGWRERFTQEVEKSIREANAFNENSHWNTRPMTDKEYKEAFGEKRESCHRLKVKNYGS